MTLGSPRGELPDMWLIGLVIYFITVFVVNNKLLLDANSLSFLPILINLLSNITVILAFLLVTLVPADSLYTMFSEFWQFFGIILTLVLFVFFSWPLATFYHFWFESEHYFEARDSVAKGQKLRDSVAGQAGEEIADGDADGGPVRHS